YSAEARPSPPSTTARQGIDEDLAEQAEPLDELVPPGSLTPQRAERHGSHDEALNVQGHRDMGPDAERTEGAPIHGRRAVRELVQVGRSHHVAPLRAAAE